MLDLRIVWLAEFQAEEEGSVPVPARITASAANVVWIASNFFEELMLSHYVSSSLVHDFLGDGPGVVLAFCSGQSLSIL